MIRRLLAATLVLAAGCGYYYFAGPLKPAESQAEAMTVADDGTVTYTQGRLSVWLRPMTEAELQRLQSAGRNAGAQSSNPYTYGELAFWATGQNMQRFTVFRLGVKNYEYPKVRIDPANIVLTAANGRAYPSLSYAELDTYFRKYAIGYRGNEYSVYQERRDLLRRTLFADDDVFSGQEQDRFIVFPVLHPDVKDIQVTIRDIALRFDFRGEPVETVDLTYRFTRKIGRQYRDGRVVFK